jgi:hypothetical protein
MRPDYVLSRDPLNDKNYSAYGMLAGSPPVPRANDDAGAGSPVAAQPTDVNKYLEHPTIRQQNDVAATNVERGTAAGIVTKLIASKVVRSDVFSHPDVARMLEEVGRTRAPKAA